MVPRDIMDFNTGGHQAPPEVTWQPLIGIGAEENHPARVNSWDVRGDGAIVDLVEAMRGASFRT